MNNPNITYRIKTDQYDVDFAQYNAFGKTYGRFDDNRVTYTVTDPNTPRQWMQYLCNDRFGSVVANDGSGFLFCGMPKYNVTKYYSETDYLIRTLNGKRMLSLFSRTSGKTYDFFSESEALTYTVGCGWVRFAGRIEDVTVTVTLFVPCEDDCECWLIHTNGDASRFILTAALDFVKGEKAAQISGGSAYVNTKVALSGQPSRDAVCVFSLQGAEASAAAYSEAGRSFFRVSLTKPLVTDQEELVVAGAVLDTERTPLEGLLKRYALETAKAALKQVEGMWEQLTSRITCSIPDANLQRFLNVWLKNQLHLTVRYNRSDLMGYRDVMQDAWGYLLVDPACSRHKLLEGLSKMYPDGRCPRQYDYLSDHLDTRDFMDSPLWAVIALVEYCKETGDLAILDKLVGYYGSEKQDSVLSHVLLALDYLYRSRGKNGLILMRQGDWLDGLEGICKYGEATTVWGTIAAFYAQKLLSELLRHIGDTETAGLLERRSAEYKTIVNAVGWDGKWYAYAFIDDEPIGSAKCHEGKIYLNPQSWAIFSGIYDDETKLHDMYRSIHTYLSTMYGPRVNAPAYKQFGERCGRLQYQVPGTFANSAIYLHVAAFKAFADGAVGYYDEALDTLQRILPGHSDSCDGRRTSEPYCVGNVYYGPEHPCFGLNLYTWFTATPAWVIHAGFETLLGVKASFDGLSIKPASITGWDAYTVTKHWRGTTYTIAFSRGDKKGIWVDGVPIDGTIVRSNAEACRVTVVY